MESTIKLSERLQKVASYLRKGTYFADIGSDHAYLPCYVCLSDSEARAIAGELNRGPYESARSTVEEQRLDQRISVRLGDGLSVISPGEVEEVAIAGMGGSLIASILEAGKEKLSGVHKIVAQPNVDARSTRKWLAEHGYQIKNETILEEKGHIYEIMAAEKVDVQITLTPQEALFGPLLIQNKTAVFIKKWQEEAEKLDRALVQMENATIKDEVKFSQFKQERTWIKEVLES